MAIFSIANALKAIHQQSVEIILQDPRYTLKDGQLLQKLAGRQLTCATDPDALLAINSNTLVVTAYLPICVLLIRVLANLGTEELERAPAAILCDSTQLDVNKKMHSLSDRSLPSAARFLTGKYDVQGFKNHKVESTLWDDAYGRKPDVVSGSERSYRLSRVQLYTRKQPVIRLPPASDLLCHHLLRVSGWKCISFLLCSKVSLYTVCEDWICDIRGLTSW